MERYDRRRLVAAAARARAIADPKSGFLFELATDEIAFRLSATNRDFRNALDWLSVADVLGARLRTASAGLSLQNYAFDDLLAEKPFEPLLGDDRFELVVSLLGLHRCDDPPAMLAAASQFLRPDGHLLAVIPGEGTLGELAETMLAVELSCRDGAGLRVEPFASVRQAGSWLQQAGLALPVADVERLTLAYSDIRSLIGELRAIGASNCLIGGRQPFPRGAYQRLEAAYRERFALPDGKLKVTVNLIFLSGWAPHASQQQPLRPGSARASLAEALGRGGIKAISGESGPDFPSGVAKKQ